MAKKKSESETPAKDQQKQEPEKNEEKKEPEKKEQEQGEEKKEPGNDEENKEQGKLEQIKSKVEDAKEVSSALSGAANALSTPLEEGNELEDLMGRATTLAGSYQRIRKVFQKDQEEPKQEVVDPISYQKMIPAFHFEVSFLKEESPQKSGQSPLDKVGDQIRPGNRDTSNESQAASIPFSDVSGLSLEIQTEDFTEGGGNDYVIRLPKPPKARNLVLKRALSATPPDIVVWAKRAVEDFVFEPRTLILSIVDYTGKAVKTWNFVKAYPVKLSLTDLSASKNEIVIETLEIAYQRVNLVQQQSQPTQPTQPTQQK